MSQRYSRRNELIPARRRGGRDVIYAVSAAFTERGRALSRKAETACQSRENREILWQNLTEIDEETFRNADVILFFCAAGIAVRKIAPFLGDKTSDPAVLVIGEDGSHVISLLSGHLGGANRWALEIAEILGGEPVITTATDSRKLPAVDLWASKCGLSIDDMKLAKKITAYLLKKNGEDEDTAIGDFPYYADFSSHPAEFGSQRNPERDNFTDPESFSGESGEMRSCDSAASEKKCGIYEKKRKYTICVTEDPRKALCEDTLILRPKRYVLGVGCRRGTDPAKMRDFILRFLEQNGIDPRLVERVCSIDRKKDEVCIKAAARMLKAPFTVFSADELGTVPGSFTGSDFVKKTVGTDNVCERAAVCGAGPESRLLVKKTIGEGMTAAAALRPSTVTENLTLTPEAWLRLISVQKDALEEDEEQDARGD